MCDGSNASRVWSPGELRQDGRRPPRDFSGSNGTLTLFSVDSEIVQLPHDSWQDKIFLTISNTKKKRTDFPKCCRCRKVPRIGYTYCLSHFSGLEYMLQFLSLMVAQYGDGKDKAGTENLVSILRESYDLTLKRHHGFVSKQLFKVQTSIEFKLSQK